MAKIEVIENYTLEEGDLELLKNPVSNPCSHCINRDITQGTCGNLQWCKEGSDYKEYLRKIKEANLLGLMEKLNEDRILKEKYKKASQEWNENRNKLVASLSEETYDILEENNLL